MNSKINTTIKFLREIQTFLNDFNTTSGRIVSTIILAFLTAIRVLFLDKIFGPIQNEVLMTWCGFICILGGWDIAQFRIKRRTFIPQNGNEEEVNNVDIVRRRNSAEHEGVEPTV